MAAGTRAGATAGCEYMRGRVCLCEHVAGDSRGSPVRGGEGRQACRGASVHAKTERWASAAWVPGRR